MSLTLRAKSILPASLWRVLKGGKRNAARGLQAVAGACGLNIDLKSNFYSPLPVRGELAASQKLWDKPSELVGVEYDLAAIKERFGALIHQFGAELRALPTYDACRAAGFGPGFPLFDGMTLYSLIRELKPRRYLEVGSGLSTYYCHLAAKRNAEEGRPVTIRCIEPYPFPALFTVPDIEINVKKVQECDLEEFTRLESGDVLFIDSSHSLKVGSDVAFLMLEVVPRLNPGVFIHIHDVPFPYNTPYPSDQTIFERNWPYYFNEAMVVQAFLAFNRSFQIVMSTPMLRQFCPGFVEQTIEQAGGEKQTGGTYASLWLQRTPGSSRDGRSA